MSTLETDLVQAATGTNTALKLKGKGSGVVKLGDGELSFPDADGSSGQSMTTNAGGNLAFATLGVAGGGTGATSLTDGGVLLGSGTSAVTAMGVLSDGQIIVGDGSTDPVAESGATLRTSIGVGTGDTPQFYGANVSGNASINRSLAVGYTDGRVPQANLDVTGNVFIGGVGSLKTGIDTSVTFASGLGVASGGTGASSLTDGGVLLGSGTSAITAMGVLSDSQMIVGDGSTDPVAESGDTLRTSIGVGSTASGTVMQIYSANTTANVRFARGVAIGYANSKVPGSNLDVKGNAVISSNVVASSLDVTNYFKVGDGAVAQPSIANLGDGNTGIWYPAADTIAVSTGGTEAIRISGVGQNTTFSSHVVSHKGLAISNYTEYANNIVNAGSSFTVSTGTNVSRYTLNSSHCEITLPAGQPIKPASMKTIILYLKQDATGGRTVDFNAPGGEALEWNNSASEPEVVSGASKVSIYTFMKFHSDTNWYCAQSFIEN